MGTRTAHPGMLALAGVLGVCPVAEADLLIEPGPDASTEIHVDIRDEHIADRYFGSIEATAALPSNEANRWYHGWLFRDARGEVHFELRPSDGAPPEAPHRRIVTAVRTDHGGQINPRYRQIGTRVWFDRDYELIRAGSTGGEWLLKGLTPETHESDGSAPLIPVELAPLWYARAGAMRQNGTGVGLAQVTLGMAPADSGSCTTTVKGYAHEESTGAVHAQDELPVHHRLGEGTYAVHTGPDTRVDLHATGFDLMEGRIRIESLPGSTSNVEMSIEIEDGYVSDGERASITTRATLPSPAANRWYYGWLWKDADGSTGFDLQLDDAPPPERPHRRIVTAVRTGPDATIRPRFRQIDDRVFFDEDVPLVERLHGTREWLERSLRSADEEAYGSEFLIPREIAPLWFSRGEVMRASGEGPGLGQITMGMLATNAHGAYSTQVKGFADTEDTATGHGQDEVPVHHDLGRGTFGYYLNTTVSANVFVTGFQIATGSYAIIHRDFEANTVLQLDLHDVQVAGGQLGSLEAAIPLSELTPERWHYGWLWKDETGNVGFEARVDDAAPPDQPFRRIVTAFLVDRNGNIFSHRLVGTRLWFDGDYEKVLYTHVEDGSWVETGFDQLNPDWGSLPFIPADITPLWYTRSEVARKPEHGNGLGEIFFGMVPSGTGSYATSIRGFAETQPPGSVFVNDELPVHHELGRGTFSFRVSDRTLANILYAGFEVFGALPRGEGVRCPTGLADATCDGIDDDCDGAVDEDAAEGCEAMDAGAPDAGVDGAVDAGPDATRRDGDAATGPGRRGGPTSGGCGCRVPAGGGSGGGPMLPLLLVLGVARWRARRQTPCYVRVTSWPSPRVA